MNIHSNARLTAHSREQIIKRYQAGETPQAIATAAGVSPATVYKWIRRYKTQGWTGLRDRSSRPHHLRAQTPEDQVMLVEDMRRARMPFWKIAMQTGLSCSTVARICKRMGLSRLKNLDPKPKIIRAACPREGGGER